MAGPKNALKENTKIWLMWTLFLGSTLGFFLYSGAILSGGEAVVGADNTETWPFLWGFFWMADSVQQGEFPYHTLLMDHPVGGTLWLKEPVFSLLYWPIQVLFGIPTVYTLTQISHSLLGAVGVFLLGKQLGLRPFPSLLAGLVYAYCPHQLGEAYNGNLDAMNIGWSPLWLAALVYVIKTPGLKPILWGGVSLLLLLVGNQYYALASAALSVPIALLTLWGIGKGHRLRAFLRTLTTGALGLLLFLPFGLGLKASMSATDQLTFIDEATPLSPPYVSDAYHLLFPLLQFNLDQRPLPFQDIVYQGGFLILLGALGLFLKRKGVIAGRLFFPMGLFFMSLSLGAVLYLKGEMILQSGRPIFLPWAYLIANTPILESMSLSHRMAVPGALCLALGLAVFLDGLSHKLGVFGKPTIAVLAALVLTEFFVHPPYAVPLATVDTPAAVHTQLLKDSRDDLPGAVINVPMSIQRNDLQRYFWFQTLHKRPVDGSFRVGSWPSITPQVPLFSDVLAPLMALSTDIPPRVDQPLESDPLGLQALLKHGYRFLVFHPRLVLFSDEIDDLMPWGKALDAALGPGIQLKDDTILYCFEKTDCTQLLAIAETVLSKGDVISVGGNWAEEISFKILGPHDQMAPQNHRPDGDNVRKPEFDRPPTAPREQP